MNKSERCILLIALCLVLVAPSLLAQAPRLLNYQGKLLTKSGAAEGSFSITFAIYPNYTGGTALWVERHANVNIVNGVFNVLLGNIKPFPENLFTGSSDRYLGITVDGEAEMRPRLRFTSTAYALSAGHADSASIGSGDRDWVVSGKNMHAAVSGNVGIGTISPSEKLVVGDDFGQPLLPGNRITIGNLSGPSGINLGKNRDNYAWLEWNDTENLLELGTRSNAERYNNTLVLKDGKVGIREREPAAVLDINEVGDLGIPSILSRNTTKDFAVPEGEEIQFGLYDVGRKIFTETMRISKNVGIGTASPKAKLEVVENDVVQFPILGLQRNPDSYNKFVEGFDNPGDNPRRKFHIDRNGTFVAGSDFAEALPVAGDKTGYEPGDVLVLSTGGLNKVEKCRQAHDDRIAGVYSTRPAVLGADKNGETRVDDDEIPVAIVGIVPTKVSALNGAIAPGDLLTTSEIPGHAMKATPTMVNGVAIYPAGTILGKAIEPLQNGTGVIKVLLMLR
jgi:hypothetical protein